MSNYIATVIKTGNSYALRVPKAYVDQANLKLGQKVRLDNPVVASEGYDSTAVRRAIRELQRVHPYQSIKDPVAWQREIRRDRPLPGRD